METTDGVVHIHHEADWSSTALVSWRSNCGPLEAAVDASLLWSDGDSDLLHLPEQVAVRAVRMATRDRVKWEHDQVLSRPVPGRVMTPWSERQADQSTAAAQTGSDKVDP